MRTFEFRVEVAVNFSVIAELVQGKICTTFNIWRDLRLDQSVVLTLFPLPHVHICEAPSANSDFGLSAVQLTKQTLRSAMLNFTVYTRLCFLNSMELDSARDVFATRPL